ncbi:MAG: hypothetical protein MHPSP_001601, partial [Paramarteilia canceri]
AEPGDYNLEESKKDIAAQSNSPGTPAKNHDFDNSIDELIFKQDVITSTVKKDSPKSRIPEILNNNPPKKVPKIEKNQLLSEKLKAAENRKKAFLAEKALQKKQVNEKRFLAVKQKRFEMMNKKVLKNNNTIKNEENKNKLQEIVDSNSKPKTFIESTLSRLKNILPFNKSGSPNSGTMNTENIPVLTAKDLEFEEKKKETKTQNLKLIREFIATKDQNESTDFVCYKNWAKGSILDDKIRQQILQPNQKFLNRCKCKASTDLLKDKFEQLDPSGNAIERFDFTRL